MAAKMHFGDVINIGAQIHVETVNVFAPRSHPPSQQPADEPYGTFQAEAETGSFQYPHSREESGALWGTVCGADKEDIMRVLTSLVANMQLDELTTAGLVEQPELQSIYEQLDKKCSEAIVAGHILENLIFHTSTMNIPQFIDVLRRHDAALAGRLQDRHRP